MKPSRSTTKRMLIPKMKILILNISNGKWNYNIKKNGALEILNEELIKLIPIRISPPTQKKLLIFSLLFLDGLYYIVYIRLILADEKNPNAYKCYTWRLSQSSGHSRWDLRFKIWCRVRVLKFLMILLVSIPRFLWYHIWKPI